ncbi:hypothetical protein CBR_g16939 [Chara braunii]|uniref:Uncharacterized protein n=1 Tax=Chara braunii TaxID=69332 RepID=A0A388KU67_CHABU|nr:hypothetical protein CBR_g16939 [Chara braunii]|eukprot:GBG73597.1 hypothetical protein CBR_g16939 [Chara braunii]
MCRRLAILDLCCCAFGVVMMFPESMVWMLGELEAPSLTCEEASEGRGRGTQCWESLRRCLSPVKKQVKAESVERDSHLAHDLGLLQGIE